MKHRCAAVVSLFAGMPATAQPCGPQQWDTAPGIPGIAGGYAAPIRGWNDGAGDRLYVGGSFTSAGGNAANAYLSRWNSKVGTWSPLGSGISGGFTNAFVACLIPFSPGGGSERLVVGGFFDTAGGVANSASLAMWNGTSWEAMGTGWTGATRGSIWASAVWNGRLYVGGGVVNTPGLIAGLPWAGMASWDGQTWVSHISSITGFNPYIAALKVYDFDNGQGEALYAVGRFDSINGVPGTSLIARWNGTAWSAVGGGLTSTTSTSGLEAITAFNNGPNPALIVGGGTFFAAGLSTCNVARWNGTQWTGYGNQIGTGRITSMTPFNDGTGTTLYIGGTAMPQINHIARYETSQWVALGGGVTGPAIPPSNFPSVFGLGVWQNKLYAGGDFSQVNSLAANGVAAWTACTPPPFSCYANCDGSSGTPLLTANDFVCFVIRYANNESYADCDGVGIPALTANDFACFVNAYAAGCT